jgi:iron complex outermembrane receptor protein
MKNRIAAGRARDGQRRARFQRIPVAEGCVAMLLGLAGAAQAQGTASAAPAASAASAAAAPQDTQQVLVTGIRRGIEDAISTKKNSSSIVEAVSSEDIGKLPDNTVAESLSRLTGLAVQRNKVNGKATDISVRGMSPAFNGSLLNGREQASTSDDRSPEFDLFPSELTGSAVVYKTPDASLMGQGLASTIDLHTLRPLDFGKRVVAASYKKERIGVDSGSAVGSGHRTTFSYVDQFADRTLGVSLGVTSFKEDNGGELVFDNWGGYAPTVDFNGAQVAVPGGFLYDTSRRKSARDGVSLTLQFKPNDQFKSTADLFFSRGTESTKKTGLEGAIPFGTGPYDPNGALTNATIVDGVATSGTFSNYKADVRNHMYSNKDRFLSAGWNGELKVADTWRLEADVSHSRGVKAISNYETTAGQPGNTPADQLGSISFSGFNGSNFADVKYTPSLSYADRGIAVLTDVDGWGGGPATPQAGYVSLPNIADTLNSVRLTSHNDVSLGPIIGTHVGANFSNRAKARSGDEGRLSILNGDGFASVTMPGSGVEMAGASGIPVASFDPTGTLGTIYALNRWVDATVLSRNWSVKEKVTTAYAMGDLDGQLGSVGYTGNVGLQFVHTDQSASGNQVDLAHCTGITVATCPYVVRTGGARYNNILPSLNLAFDLGHDQKLRLGAGKQISRANLDNMKASMDFGVQNAGALEPALTGFAGNPQLKPYAARSLDLSYEKYFGKYGYVSVAAFLKKLDNYVINAPRQFDFAPFTSPTTPLPDHGPFAGSTVGFLTMPTNGQGGNLHGFEFSINIPFSMIAKPLDGFGVAANYSITQSSVKLPTSGFVSPENGPVFKNQVSTIGLPGLSRDVGSVRVYYEAHGFQVAWAAHKRSAFIGQILDYRSDSQFTFIKGEVISDLQVSYEFQDGWLKGLSGLLQAHNLTNTPFQEYTSDPNVITNSVKYGKTYTAGLSYKF